jgi:hypothetical protein
MRHEDGARQVHWSGDYFHGKRSCGRRGHLIPSPLSSFGRESPRKYTGGGCRKASPPRGGAGKNLAIASAANTYLDGLGAVMIVRRRPFRRDPTPARHKAMGHPHDWRAMAGCTGWS